MDARVQSTMEQKLTSDCVQNAVEDLIPAEKFIEGATKALADNIITLAEAFMKACR